ncbi:Spo0E family sporulation regulatory protein-aspartic acid phosphatase [Neobacillus mesonae]|uniref:Spo0E family sporulation regulatory protein-aspartic acid phosphatase n=1 Tax=Neobacillus mesonae TaxID=1193713 RepID=UPI0037C8B5CC
MNKCFLELLLLKTINEQKSELTLVAKLNGITSPETVQCSQKLDILLNIHNKIQSENTTKQ